MAKGAVFVNVVLVCAGVVLMALGAAEAVRCAALRLLKGGRESRGRAVIVLLPQGPEDCEGLIRTAGERMRWSGGCRMLCAVKDEESREIAERLRGRYKGLEVCGAGELRGRLEAGM